MSNFERTTSWQQIQQGVKEAERLIVSKDYNLVMVKARQTLECIGFGVWLRRRVL